MDGQSVKKFSQRVEQELELLHQQLKAGQYQPRDVLRVWIDKPGTKKQRPLGIPTVRDRVVQTALRQVIEPIFEAKFMAQSYGFRPGRGCKDALRRVSELLEAGYHWVVDADIVSYLIESTTRLSRRNSVRRSPTARCSSSSTPTSTKRFWKG